MPRTTDIPVISHQRDFVVLRLAAEGLTTSEIAATLHPNEGTVRNYLPSAISTLGVRNRIEAARGDRDRDRL